MQNSDNVKKSLCTPIDHKPCRPHLRAIEALPTLAAENLSLFFFFLFSFSESHWKLLEAYRRCVRRHKRWNCSQFIQQKERKEEKNFVKMRREKKNVSECEAAETHVDDATKSFSVNSAGFTLGTPTKKSAFHLPQLPAALPCLNDAYSGEF